MPSKAERLIQFEVESIECPACVGIVENMICNDDPSLKVRVDLLQKKVSVIVPEDIKKTDEEWLKLFTDKLKDVDMVVAAPEKKIQTDISPKKRISTQTLNIIKGALGLSVGAVFLGLSISGLAVPLFIMYGLSAIGAALTVYLGWDTYRTAYKEWVYSKSLTMDALFTVSTITALIVSTLSLFVPWLPMMWDTALIIFGFKYVGNVIKDAVKHEVVKGTHFCDRIPKYVLGIKEDKEKLVPVSSLKPNDQIRVRSGEYIPVDGNVEDDESAVLETIKNGQPFLAFLKKGDGVLAGMQVPMHVESMKIKVSKSEKESELFLNDKFLNEPPLPEAEIEIKAKKIVRHFTEGVFSWAALCLAIKSAISGIAIGMQCMVATLVSACPCTFGLIIPSAIRIGMNKARENGGEFKGAAALEKAGRVDALVFDVNGTLTEGAPKVTRIFPIDSKITEKDALRYLHALENGLPIKHPVAQAIVNYSEARLDEKDKIDPSSVKYDEKKFASGVRAYIDGAWYMVGNLNLLRLNGVDVAPILRSNSKKLDQKIFLAKEKEVLCQVQVTDPLRKDAKKVINELRKIYKKICLCTGADKETAEDYANTFGIPHDDVYSECTALGKTKVIESLIAKKYYPALIGDAGNDALAAKVCFGVAITSKCSDPVMLDRALLVIDSDHLTPVLSAFVVAKQMASNINQSIITTLIYNTVTLLAAGGGFVAPIIGAALMFAQACLVYLNAYIFKIQAIPGLDAIKSDNKEENSANTSLINSQIKQSIALNKSLEKKNTDEKSTILQELPVNSPTIHSSNETKQLIKNLPLLRFS